MRTVSVEQLIQAIELNNYPQGYRHMIEHDDKTQPVIFENDIVISPINKHILNACAWGIASLNLGVTPQALEKAFTKNKMYHVVSMVIRANDDAKETVPAIAELMRIEFVLIMNNIVEVEEFDYAPLFDNYQGRLL